jgi:hypothetical protein
VAVVSLPPVSTRGRGGGRGRPRGNGRGNGRGRGMARAATSTGSNSVRAITLGVEKRAGDADVVVS